MAYVKLSADLKITSLPRKVAAAAMLTREYITSLFTNTFTLQLSSVRKRKQKILTGGHCIVTADFDYVDVMAVNGHAGILV